VNVENIVKYFSAEKSESLLFLAVGIIMVLTSGYFLFKLRQPFTTGMAYPLITIALIQLTVGSSIYLRSPKDISRVTELVQNNSSRVQSEEVPRMEAVMKNFVLYRWVEIVLIVIGLFLLFLPLSSQLRRGVGLGLLIQSSLMLVLDLFAENRGKTYLEFLQKISS
jgi:DMSO reductase anchor subunit